MSITADTQRGSAGVEAIVKYVFRDGNAIDLKGCSFLDFIDDQVRSYRVYIDTS